MFPIIKHPGFIIIMPSFRPFSIVFSNQRFSNCSCTVDVGFVKLLSDWFCGNKIFKMNIEFCHHLCRSSSVIVRHNPLQWTIIPLTQFVFWPLILLANDVFSWFVYAVITLEIAALDAHKKVAILVTDAPAKCTPTICPLWKSDKSPILWYIHMNRYSTQSVMHWHRHYTA